MSQYTEAWLIFGRYSYLHEDVHQFTQFIMSKNINLRNHTICTFPSVPSDLFGETLTMNTEQTAYPRSLKIDRARDQRDNALVVQNQSFNEPDHHRCRAHVCRLKSLFLGDPFWWCQQQISRKISHAPQFVYVPPAPLLQWTSVHQGGSHTRQPLLNLKTTYKPYKYIF